MAGSFFDTNILLYIAAAALHADCDTLLSEDMQHNCLLEGRLRIRNPFRP